ncbi:hypothetical protein [Streptomyces sp. NPDC097981]|uniref:hypothetical protein n=1 Tax=Streptomyces sp. NPDC097981 TaxID=3155428 RepID=UPI0033271A25
MASNLTGVTAVNNSWAISDQPGKASEDFHFTTPGVAYTAASGDLGGQTFWPSVSPNVASVGGTRLTRAPHTARGWTESGWVGSGGGCALYEPPVAFQQGFTFCLCRATPDVSAVADPDSGLAVYTTTPTPTNSTGWQVAGGTGVSAPLVAGMYALAGRPDPAVNTYPYARPGAFHDIVIGCAGAFCAIPGYDLVTGIGTPRGVRGLRAPRQRGAQAADTAWKFHEDLGFWPRRVT